MIVLCTGGGTAQIQESTVILGMMNENALKSGFGSIVETDPPAGKTQRKIRARVRVRFLLKRVKMHNGGLMITRIIESFCSQKTDGRTRILNMREVLHGLLTLLLLGCKPR